MTDVIHLWPQGSVQKNGKITISTIIEMPKEKKKTLWYSVPENHKEHLSINADPFVIAVIYLIMQSGFDARIHGEVSPSLLYNLEDFQTAWTAWIPEFEKGDIQADHEKEPIFTQPRNESVVAFSGGVDSCFTVYSQAKSMFRPNPNKLTTGVMVQGFDIPLDQPDVFESAFKRSKTLVSSLGLNLIPISTNYQKIGANWIHSFGAAAASCLAIFSNKFRAGYISQNLTYKEAIEILEGSNPLTEPLLSSDTFKILPGGSQFDRAGKIFSMRNWQEFKDHLRVCWQGPQKDRNCCECEKCTRNILTFRALGLGLPPCFPKDISDSQIKTFFMGGKNFPKMRYGKLPAIAKARGEQGEWIKLLEKRLNYIKHMQRTKDSIPWRIQRKLKRLAKKIIMPIISIFKS